MFRSIVPTTVGLNNCKYVHVNIDEEYDMCNINKDVKIYNAAQDVSNINCKSITHLGSIYNIKIDSLEKCKSPEEIAIKILKSQNWENKRKYTNDDEYYYKKKKRISNNIMEPSYINDSSYSLIDHCDNMYERNNYVNERNNYMNEGSNYMNQGNYYMNERNIYTNEYNNQLINKYAINNNMNNYMNNYNYYNNIPYNTFSQNQKEVYHNVSQNNYDQCQNYNQTENNNEILYDTHVDHDLIKQMNLLQLAYKSRFKKSNNKVKINETLLYNNNNEALQNIIKCSMNKENNDQYYDNLHYNDNMKDNYLLNQGKILFNNDSTEKKGMYNVQQTNEQSLNENNYSHDMNYNINLPINQSLNGPTSGQKYIYTSIYILFIHTYIYNGTIQYRT
ncbi:hypothetical protein PFFVO_04366 [Plasmodium falciparum Vietnam Oak-Knoll (FVO)]|uniref:Uncharacterized protein n=1 Tax=Plasmodium falciparum Vietnam Oak-Knoll (FVO) TaxID=1036723 RepID=A0A024V2M1_PLAFA|nr:hypothetical protein PFFVO_04366 [Plasmodium falciparum Vietnam Oak-Knoll (FVO)]